MVIHTTCPRHPQRALWWRGRSVGRYRDMAYESRLLSDQCRPFIVANLELLFEFAVLGREGGNPFGVRFVA